MRGRPSSAGCPDRPTVRRQELIPLAADISTRRESARRRTPPPPAANLSEPTGARTRRVLLAIGRLGERASSHPLEEALHGGLDLRNGCAKGRGIVGVCPREP